MYTIAKVKQGLTGDYVIVLVHYMEDGSKRTGATVGRYSDHADAYHYAFNIQALLDSHKGESV